MIASRIRQRLAAKVMSADEVLIRAFRDVQLGGLVGDEAAAWLVTDRAALFLAACGADPEGVGGAIERVRSGSLRLRWRHGVVTPRGG